MIKGYICPDGEKVNKEDCLKSCRMSDRCATKSYLKQVAADRVWAGKPSTTQLLNGTCESYLRIKEDYFVEPDSMAFAISGTRKHDQFEQSGELPEERMEVDGITGIADELEEGWLIDYKTAGSYKVAQVMGIVIEKTDIPTGEFFKNGNPKTKKESKIIQINPDFGDYQLQLNLYRIMYQSAGHDIKGMKIFFIVRDGGTYMAKNRGILKNTYLTEVPFIDDNEVLDYYRRKRDELIFAIENDEYPERCNSDETWQGRKCLDYCPVREVCKYNINKG